MVKCVDREKALP